MKGMKSEEGTIHGALHGDDIVDYKKVKVEKMGCMKGMYREKRISYDAWGVYAGELYVPGCSG